MGGREPADETGHEGSMNRPSGPTPVEAGGEKGAFMRNDGTFDIRKVGLSRPFIRDLYHWLRTTSWPRTFLAIAIGWFGSNALFAALYLLGGDCIGGARPGSLADAFFFSVQTFSTIGYGGLSPTTDYANVVSVVEAFYGLLFVAVSTGLVFSKFGAPTARILFAEEAIIRTFRGKRTLLFRLANTRESQIVEATVRVSVARDEKDDKGSLFRRVYDLRLVRDTSPLFALTWTVMHVIDEESPLYEMTPEQLADERVILLVTMKGTEDRLAATVHARHVYLSHQLVFDRRYTDILLADDDGERYVDYRLFHKHERL